MGGDSQNKGDRAPLVSACCGIIGSTCGKACTHPIDTIKARLQVIPGANVPTGKGSLILNTAQEVMKNEGIRGLYRGMPTSLIGGIPAAFLYFGAYEFWKYKTL